MGPQCCRFAFVITESMRQNIYIWVDFVDIYIRAVTLNFTKNRVVCVQIDYTNCGCICNRSLPHRRGAICHAIGEGEASTYPSSLVSASWFSLSISVIVTSDTPWSELSRLLDVFFTLRTFFSVVVYIWTSTSPMANELTDPAARRDCDAGASRRLTRPSRPHPPSEDRNSDDGRLSGVLG